MVRMFFSASPVRLGSMKTWLSETHQTKNPKFFVPIELCRFWKEEDVFFGGRKNGWIFPPQRFKMKDLMPPKGSKAKTSTCYPPVLGVQNVKTGIGEKVIRDTFEARSKIRRFFLQK